MHIFCTFVVPTIGRPTLERTLQSIAAQTTLEWNALVIADCLDGFSLPRVHNHIFSLNTDFKRGAPGMSGLVRDCALSHACGEWIGFVDDDDTIDPRYVEWLKEEGASADVVIFRMTPGGGYVLPPGNELFAGGVGISYAIRAAFQRDHNLWFPNSPIEDWIFLQMAMSYGARVKVSSRVAYFIRH